MHRMVKICRFGVILLAGLVLAVPALGGCGTIPAGEWLFIGEEGLDITGTGVTAGSQIAYYGPGGSISSVPAAMVTVADPASFYVSPSVFSGKTGPWFLLPGNSLVFYVGDPTLQVRIVDHTSGFSVSRDASWIPKGDAVGFRIDTNLWVFSRRPGCTGVPLTIEITGPGGLSLSSLDGYSLKDVVVSSPTFETGPVWQTGSGDFPIGEYMVSVRCEENGMHDNYPLAGKTESETVQFLLQRVNPLIVTVTTPGAVPITMPSATVSQQETTPLSTGTTAETTLATTIPETAETEPVPVFPTPTRAAGMVPATLFLAFCVILAAWTHRYAGAGGP